jgi:hypothetical protein
LRLAREAMPGFWKTSSPHTKNPTKNDPQKP